jgi:hypothetical protein
MAQGHVFVTHVGEPRHLSELVGHLVSAGVDVIVEPDNHEISGALPEGQLVEKASALLLALGNGADLGPHRYEIDRRLVLGSLVPVLLAPSAKVDASWGLRPVDLSTWAGGSHPEVDRLLRILHALVGGVRPSPWAADALYRDSAVDSVEHAVSELRELTGQVGQLGELLIGDDRHRAQLVEALDQVGATYRAVTDALERYAAAAGHGTERNRLQYHALARDNLMDRIHNGRGSCGRIGTLYRRAGGLREALVERADADVVATADRAFGRLIGSDYTLFDQMERLGETLTTEARAVENLLRTGQGDAADRRILAGWGRLGPLEESLGRARRDLQAVQVRLGYVERAPGKTGEVTVSISKVTINGTVHDSNIVAAQWIENSSITVASAPIPEDLKAALAALHEAVAKLTLVLPDDEAALAGRDLEDLSREATSPAPRQAFWRRAIDGLVGAAQKVTTVGTPVVDLANKVASLLAAAGG